VATPRAPQRGEVDVHAEVSGARALQRVHHGVPPQRLQAGGVGRAAAIVHQQRAAAGVRHAARQVGRDRHGLAAHLDALQRVPCARRGPRWPPRPRALHRARL